MILLNLFEDPPPKAESQRVTLAPGAVLMRGFVCEDDVEPLLAVWSPSSRSSQRGIGRPQRAGRRGCVFTACRRWRMVHMRWWGAGGST